MTELMSEDENTTRDNKPTANVSVCVRLISIAIRVKQLRVCFVNRDGYLINSLLFHFIWISQFFYLDV